MRKMWTNIVDLDRPQIKTWHVRIVQVKQSFSQYSNRAPPYIILAFYC